MRNGLSMIVGILPRKMQLQWVDRLELIPQIEQKRFGDFNDFTFW